MNIQIIADNLELSPADRFMILEKVETSLEKLLTHLSPDQKVASVKVEKDKFNNYNINFDMNLPGKEHVYAETNHVGFESALIDLIQAVEKQIKKYKQN